MHKHLKVKNIQPRAIRRGGTVFPGEATTEVDVKMRQSYAEIQACVYLRIIEETDLEAEVEEVDDTEDPDAVLAEGPATKPELPENVTKDDDSEGEPEGEPETEETDPDDYRWIKEAFNLNANQARALYEAGYTDFDALRGATADDLEEIKGVGRPTAETVVRYFDEN